MKEEKWINTERFIIKGLLENETYFRKVFTNLDESYFSNKSSFVLRFIKNYFRKYDRVPPYSVIENVISESAKISDKQIEVIIKFLKETKKLDFKTEENEDWLFDQTKAHVKEKALFNFMQDTYAQFNDETLDYNQMWSKMSDIVSINWDENLGVFYSDMDHFDEIFDILSDDDEKIPTGIVPLDRILGGGVIRKCLMVVTGEANIGKTMVLSNLTLNAIKANKNVLYISFEIPKEQLHLRFTSSFVDLNIRGLVAAREEVKNRIRKIYEKGGVGEFVIKEYPPSSITSLDLDNYIRELKIKRNFTPDAIVVDYLGIMKPNDKYVQGSYEKGEEVCKDLRKLSFKYNCPVLSAAQNNRGAYGEERVGMGDVANSIGIATTSDLMIGVTNPPSFAGLDQLRFEIIKSRFSEHGKSFIIPYDKEKLKLLNDEITIESQEPESEPEVDIRKKREEKINQHKKKQTENYDDEIDMEDMGDNDTRNASGIKIK